MQGVRANFAAALRAVESSSPLTANDRDAIIIALQLGVRTAPEVSLIPAVLAKMEESCDLLREVRDMMKHTELRVRAHDFGVPVKNE